MREKGIEPYPLRFQRTHTAQESLDRFDELAASKETVRLAGRILTVRKMGKAAFAHIEDASGRIQLYLRLNILGEESYTTVVDLYDLGDIVGAEGTLFRTRTGEATLEVHRIAMLAKALQNPPEKFHGLRDTETRLRQRYLDLAANPDVRHTISSAQPRHPRGARILRCPRFPRGRNARASAPLRRRLCPTVRDAP